MKKTYEKPLVMFENFELSQNIAVCAWDVKNQATAQICGAIGDEELGLQGTVIFYDKAPCEDDYNEFGGEEIFCYTQSSDEWTIFNS